MDDQNTTSQPRDSEGNSWRLYLNPVVFLAVVIVFSVLVLIGAAIVGWDRGVLSNMSKIEFARGLITYLFAVVTIGTAVVLVVSALTSGEGERNERRFQRGKEILSLLLGVFGTIVGFYFGSEVTRARDAEQTLQVSPMRASNQVPAPGEKIMVRTFVSGGAAPYKFALGLAGEPLDKKEFVEAGGWIEKEIIVPSESGGKSLKVWLEVADADGHIARQSVQLDVRPKA